MKLIDYSSRSRKNKWRLVVADAAEIMDRLIVAVVSVRMDWIRDGIFWKREREKVGKSGLDVL